MKKNPGRKERRDRARAARHTRRGPVLAPAATKNGHNHYRGGDRITRTHTPGGMFAASGNKRNRDMWLWHTTKVGPWTARARNRRRNREARASRVANR